MSKSSAKSRSKPSENGMVLIAVLWVVAALSILVTGISQGVRQELRMVSGAKDVVQAQAVAEAAIQLVLQELITLPARPRQTTDKTITYRDTQASVETMPLNGLIDINKATVELLIALLKHAGGLSADQASAVAQAMVTARERKDAQGRPMPFEATEDLLQVPAFDFDLYGKVEGLITVNQGGSGRVNPLAAPLGVLVVLADGNIGRAQRIVTDRTAGAIGIDTSNLNANVIDTSETSRFRVQARVPMADGRWLRLSQSVDANRAGPPAPLPWRIFSSDTRMDMHGAV